jgi:CBS domain containing-hemolysin-like protein
MKSAIEESAQAGFLPDRLKQLSHVVLSLDEVPISNYAIDINEIEIVGDEKQYQMHKSQCESTQALIRVGESERNVYEIYLRNPISDVYSSASFIVMPENANVLKGLSEYFERGTIAILLVDEYGRIKGVVPTATILKSIFTVRRNRKTGLISRIGSSYIVNGTARLDELSRMIGTDLKGRHAKTLGGFLSEISGSIPEKGEIISQDFEGNIKIDFRILKANEKQAELIAVKRYANNNKSSNGNDHL